MLLPRFSLKTILATMTLCALVFVIVGQAVRGSAWALGVSMAIGSIVLALLIYALMFLIVWVCAQVLEREGASPAVGSAAGGSLTGRPTGSEEHGNTPASEMKRPTAAQQPGGRV